MIRLQLYNSNKFVLQPEHKHDSWSELRVATETQGVQMDAINVTGNHLAT